MTLVSADATNEPESIITEHKALSGIKFLLVKKFNPLLQEAKNKKKVFFRTFIAKFYILGKNLFETRPLNN